MELKLLDVSAVIGLCAMVTLTINVLLGLLLSTAYKASARWKKLPGAVKKIDILWLHNWTAYLALILVLLHPLLLVLDASTKFTFLDIFFPLHAPKQAFFVTFGVLAMYALITVIITTQKVVKKRMSFRLWKNIHLISYGTAMLFIVHGLMMDPELKDRPTDWLDGEKLLCGACLAVLIAATFLRLKYNFKQAAKPKKILPDR
ncbi:MAG TPA: ferric reductase-like transmembrane domain-containing protein [Mucilaginibacter sp.]|jgi:sulfoxide reductase heme-binding subunit YedZ|nr:ferric reductase-like transmembrane domain-containing protein [Mucilaginibacter sp.]